MIDYQTKSYEQSIQEQLSNNADNTLILARGRYTPDKEEMSEDIAAQLNKNVRTINLDELLVKNDEVASINHLKKAFEEADPDKEVLYIKRGDRLSGVYTGHTLSSTRYTSPQERVLFQLIDEFTSPVIIGVELKDAVDETLERRADLIVNCALPSNLFKRLSFQLKNYTLHGIDLTDNYRTNASFKSRLN